MPAWGSYSFKEAAPADTDTLMIKDNATTDRPNKQLSFSWLWNWVMSKTYAFTQGTKTIPAAINELNSGKANASDVGDLTDAIGDLRDAVASEFSDQSTYTAGQMVLKNGVLYRFTSDHSGAWMGTDAEVVTVGGEVTDLKADLNASNVPIFDTVYPGYFTEQGTIGRQSATNKEVYTDKVSSIYGKSVKFTVSHSASRSMWICYCTWFEDGTVTRTVVKNTSGSTYSSVVDFPEGAVAIAFSFRTFDDCEYSFELTKMKSWKNPFESLSEKVDENANVPNMFTSINDLELVADLTTTNSSRAQNFRINLDAGYYYETVSCPSGYSIIHNYRDDSVSYVNPIVKISKPLTEFKVYVSPSAVEGINVKLYKLSNKQANWYFNDVSRLTSDPLYINEFANIMRVSRLDERPYSKNRISSNVLYLHGRIKVSLTSYEVFNPAIQVFNLNTMKKIQDTSWVQTTRELLIKNDECVVILLKKIDDSYIVPSDVPENLVMVSADLYYKDDKPYSAYERFLIDAEISANTERIEALEEVSSDKPGNEILKRLRNDAPCYDHLYVSSNNPIIPHESLYHLRLSKKMGFKVIEANVKSTSDGVFIVNHLNSGAFGNYFKHVDGVTDISNVQVSDVTWDWIVQNVRYNTPTVKYQTRPSRLEEFLEECNTHDMIPFVALGVTPTGVYSWEIAEKIMGANNYIAYGGSRDIVGDAPIFTWDMQSNSVEAILTKCQQIGAPLIWGSMLSRFEDNVVEEIINTLHEHGFFVGASYADANWDKYRQMGADFNGTQSLINRITNGNIGDNHSSFNWDEFTITGNPTNDNNILTFGSGGNIVPVIPNDTYNYSGYDIEITFKGTVTVTDASGNTTKTHDDMATWQIAKPVYTASPSVTISVSAGTVIFDVHYTASRF